MNDRHALYEVAVQSVEWELDFLARLYRRRHGREARLFREDFCSTAALATAWARRGPEHHSVAVDLDPEPLGWARRHRLPFEPDAAARVRLIRGDVRRPHGPPVDVACALNFSWWVFHRRRDLLAYLVSARAGLARGGLLVLDAFGGAGAEKPLVERTPKPAGRAVDGRPTPAFTYVWEQAELNALDRRLVAHIHFELRGGRAMKRAFSYDWRMWTLPELRELAAEAGFADFEVYSEGWNAEHGRETGRMHKRVTLDNEDGWTASCVAYR